MVVEDFNSCFTLAPLSRLLISTPTHGQSFLFFFQSFFVLPFRSKWPPIPGLDAIRKGIERPKLRWKLILNISEVCHWTLLFFFLDLETAQHYVTCGLTSVTFVTNLFLIPMANKTGAAWSSDLVCQPKGAAFHDILLERMVKVKRLQSVIGRLQQPSFTSVKVRVYQPSKNG